MSQAARPPDPDDQRRGMTPRPKRGRALMLGIFFGLIVFVFLFITLVSQCGADDDDEVFEPQGTALVVDGAAPPPVGA